MLQRGIAPLCNREKIGRSPGQPSKKSAFSLMRPLETHGHVVAAVGAVLDGVA
ncbi:hypothetical protein [Roseovarius azorensis]|uniref:hypothetical protein n=1 Tax=Roseovarius azorensis TaxID=1287727 RepID=UPI0015870FB3|nr:hypothetical protein [Roseovarius azorensis]